MLRNALFIYYGPFGTHFGKNHEKGPSTFKNLPNWISFYVNTLLLGKNNLRILKKCWEFISSSRFYHSAINGRIRASPWVIVILRIKLLLSLPESNQSPPFLTINAIHEMLIPYDFQSQVQVVILWWLPHTKKLLWHHFLPDKYVLLRIIGLLLLTHLDASDRKSAWTSQFMCLIYLYSDPNINSTFQKPNFKHF